MLLKMHISTTYREWKGAPMKCFVNSYIEGWLPIICLLLLKILIPATNIIQAEGHIAKCRPIRRGEGLMPTMWCRNDTLWAALGSG